MHHSGITSSAYNERALLEHTLAPIKQVSEQVIVVDMGAWRRQRCVLPKHNIGRNDLVGLSARKPVPFWFFASGNMALRLRVTNG